MSAVQKSTKPSSTYCFCSDKECNLSKKIRNVSLEPGDLNGEDSVFNLLSGGSNAQPVNPNPKKSEHLASFYKAAEDEALDSNAAVVEESKPTPHVPIDWSLKLKLRILSSAQISGSRLKSSEEASGITGCASI